MTNHRSSISVRASLLVPVALGLVAFAGLAGCDKKPAATNETPVSAAAPVVPAAAPSPAPAASVASPNESLMGRLTREAQSRPTIQPTADDVLAAFERSGAPVARRQQSLGATYDAAYCTGGTTNDQSLAFTVCEYPDATTAQAGRDHSHVIFANMKTRDVWARKATTVAIIQLKDSASASALEKKLAQTYATL